MDCPGPRPPRAARRAKAVRQGQPAALLPSQEERLGTEDQEALPALGSRLLHGLRLGHARLLAGVQAERSLPLRALQVRGLLPPPVVRAVPGGPLRPRAGDPDPPPRGLRRRPGAPPRAAAQGASDPAPGALRRLAHGGRAAPGEGAGSPSGQDRASRPEHGPRLAQGRGPDQRADRRLGRPLRGDHPRAGGGRRAADWRS